MTYACAEKLVAVLNERMAGLPSAFSATQAIDAGEDLSSSRR